MNGAGSFKRTDQYSSLGNVHEVGQGRKLAALLYFTYLYGISD